MLFRKGLLKAWQPKRGIWVSILNEYYENLQNIENQILIFLKSEETISFAQIQKMAFWQTLSSKSLQWNFLFFVLSASVNVVGSK
jgi:hypothetical protein